MEQKRPLLSFIDFLFKNLSLVYAQTQTHYTHTKTHCKVYVFLNCFLHQKSLHIFFHVARRHNHNNVYIRPILIFKNKERGARMQIRVHLRMQVLRNSQEREYKCTASLYIYIYCNIYCNIFSIIYKI